MSETESDDLEQIREQKRRELLETETESDSASTDSPDHPVYVEDHDDLGRLVERHDIVLADFYADWCGPCQMLSPILEAVAADTPATVVKVDTEQHPALAREHGVQGLPTLVLFVDGRPGERLVGLQDETTLRNLIDSHTD